MRNKIQTITLKVSILTFIMLFLSACSPTLQEQVAQYPVADSIKPYVGVRIAAMAPVGNEYHIRDISYRDIDYLIFVKAANNESIKTAFAKSYRLERNSADLNATQTLKLATLRAKVEHSMNIKSLEYKVTDMMLVDVSCKRIDFSGKYKGKSSSYIVGYDIHCIHPEWVKSNDPFLVRIGTNYVHSVKDEQNVLPVELETFYQNVVFIQKN